MTEMPSEMRLKLFTAQFETVSTTWINTIVMWIIDSRYRTTKRLDSFIKDQLLNPHPDIEKLAAQFTNPNPDERIIDILKYVFEHMVYKPDIETYGTQEYWASAYKAWNRKSDDCDGINGLVGILALMSGMTSEQVYFAIGDTAGGGHFWLLYYSFAKDKLYVIDSTYYVDFTPLRSRGTFALSDARYRAIWFVFNADGIYKAKQAD